MNCTSDSPEGAETPPLGHIAPSPPTIPSPPAPAPATPSHATLREQWSRLESELTATVSAMASVWDELGSSVDPWTPPTTILEEVIEVVTHLVGCVHDHQHPDAAHDGTKRDSTNVEDVIWDDVPINRHEVRRIRRAERRQRRWERRRARFSYHPHPITTTIVPSLDRRQVRGLDSDDDDDDDGDDNDDGRMRGGNVTMRGDDLHSEDGGDGCEKGADLPGQHGDPYHTSRGLDDLILKEPIDALAHPEPPVVTMLDDHCENDDDDDDDDSDAPILLARPRKVARTERRVHRRDTAVGRGNGVKEEGVQGPNPHNHSSPRGDASTLSISISTTPSASFSPSSLSASDNDIVITMDVEEEIGPQSTNPLPSLPTVRRPIDSSFIAAHEPAKSTQTNSRDNLDKSTYHDARSTIFGMRPTFRRPNRIRTVPGSSFATGTPSIAHGGHATSPGRLETLRSRILAARAKAAAAAVSNSSRAAPFFPSHPHMNRDAVWDSVSKAWHSHVARDPVSKAWHSQVARDGKQPFPGAPKTPTAPEISSDKGIRGRQEIRETRETRERREKRGKSSVPYHNHGRQIPFWIGRGGVTSPCSTRNQDLSYCSGPGSNIWADAHLSYPSADQVESASVTWLRRLLSLSGRDAPPPGTERHELVRIAKQALLSLEIDRILGPCAALAEPDADRAVLRVDEHASEADVRVAYRRLSLACHPDKNRSDPRATAAFAVLTRAYKRLQHGGMGEAKTSE